jgi:PLP dependent protein
MRAPLGQDLYKGLTGNEHEMTAGVNEVTVTDKLAENSMARDILDSTAFGTSAIVLRWRGVVAEVRRELETCGRPADAAEIVCVSKTQPTSSIERLLEAGARCFGENRVQEAVSKWPSLRARYSDLSLHLIGPLQTNKVDEALSLFDVIETLDRLRLAEALCKRKEAGKRLPDLFVQVNTGSEPQKSGVSPQEADSFLQRCREDFGLAIVGLMCIPPVGQSAAPHFALLANIASRHGLRRLSMGMSADYASALQLGATEVRIGTAIFGEREQPSPAT